MSSVEREGLTLGRAEESLDQPSGESPRPWRKRMATLLGLDDGGVGVDAGVSLLVLLSVDDICSWRAVAVDVR